MSKKTTPTNEIPFEQAMQRLEAIAEKIEDGKMGLDESLNHFEEGMQLAKYCEEFLNKASGRIEKIMKDFSGKEKIVEIKETDL